MMLTSARLVLREFEGGDWADVLAYQSDPLYLRYTPWTYRTEEDVRNFVRIFTNWRDEQPRWKFQFAIMLRGEGRLIGNCGIRVHAPRQRQADIGYELDSRYWRKGYATEAAWTLLAFGFEELGLHRIWAQCVGENTASAHVLEKIGMRLEGRMREDEWFRNRWWDSLVFAILEYEWPARA